MFTGMVEMAMWLSQWWVVWSLTSLASLVSGVCLYLGLAFWSKQKVIAKAGLVWCLWSQVPLMIVFLIFPISASQDWEWLFRFIFSPVSFLEMANYRIAWIFMGVWVSLLGLPISFGIRQLALQMLVTKKIKLLSVKHMFVATLICGLAGGAMLQSLWILEEVVTQAPSEFHIFNAHLKDVCSQAKWQQQCPRTMADLRNYDTKNFDTMARFSKVYYYFDYFGYGTLLVRTGNLVQVSDTRFSDRFSAFWISGEDDLLTKYPPNMPGQWDQVR